MTTETATQLDLPAELVLLILRGLGVADVLNVSRSSSALRSLILSNPSAWVHACDAYTLPLPAGESPRSVPASLLPYFAARAVSISALFCSSRSTAPSPLTILHPRGAGETPVLASTCIYSQLGTLPPNVLTVLPGGRTLLVGHIGPGRPMQLGVYGIGARGKPEGQWQYLLVDPVSTRFDPPQKGGDHAVDWASIPGDADGVRIAVLQNRYDEKRDLRCCAEVFRLDFTPGKAAPQVQRSHSIELPFCAEGICVRGSLVMGYSANGLALIDLDTMRRICWIVGANSEHQRGSWPSETIAATLDLCTRRIVLAINSGAVCCTRTVSSLPIPDPRDACWGSDWNFCALDLSTHCDETTSCTLPATPLTRPIAQTGATHRLFHNDEGEVQLLTTSQDRRHAFVSAPKSGAQSSTCMITQDVVSCSRSSFHHLSIIATSASPSSLVDVYFPGRDVRLKLNLCSADVSVPEGRNLVVVDDIYGLAVVCARQRLFVFQY
ncbi:unnamed protein product [Mycena citricolor]|uniref:F-box domain-containing protein n=1 Tax=Mycena citricolor TaxID=2018698 RepID=A0AAD2HGD6_9AGAR|nr:unnamed protein product [Mycena citricolor]